MMKRAAIVALCLVVPLCATARDAVGRVTGVADGDTFYVMLDGKSTRVRLAQVDAPEKKQAFGRVSEQSLRELVAKKDVALSWSEIDQYGRPIVRVKVGSIDVNAAQVERGMAWVYRAFAHDPKLIQLEGAAKVAKRGLWSDTQPVPPWDWRRANKGDIEHGRLFR